MLLFKVKELLVQPGGLILGYVVKSILVEYLGPFVLFKANFKLRELHEEVLIKGLVTQLSQRSLVEESTLVSVPVELFEFGRLDVAVDIWEDVYELFQDCSAVL